MRRESSDHLDRRGRYWMLAWHLCTHSFVVASIRLEAGDPRRTSGVGGVLLQKFGIAKIRGKDERAARFHLDIVA